MDMPSATPIVHPPLFTPQAVQTSTENAKESVTLGFVRGGLVSRTGYMTLVMLPQSHVCKLCVVVVKDT
jgi:hypothetical protein